MHWHAQSHHSHEHELAQDGAGTAQSVTAILTLAVAATVSLVLLEFLAGYWGRSIALISDAVHNLTDVPTLVISWFAVRWAQRPPTYEKTFGYHRAGILAAFANAMILAFVAVYVLYESFVRLRNPVEPDSGLMIWVSVLALAVNGGITLALLRSRRDLNLRSVLIHNFGDALSNIGIFAGAVAIRLRGIAWVDGALGLGIGALVLWSVGGVLSESTHILLEGLPRGLRLEDVARALLEIESVQEVHDIHIWTLGTDLIALSCHMRIPDMHMEESEKILERVRACLVRDFRIAHATIQFERAGLPAESGYFMPKPVPPQEKN